MSRLAGRLWLGLFVIFLTAPLMVVAVMSVTDQLYLTFPPTGFSLRWYAQVWQQQRWWTAAANSLLIGAGCAALSVVLGTLTALAAARSGMRTVALLAALMVAPMMLPHIIVAIGLYPTMLDLRLTGTMIAVIIGHAVVATPFVVTTVAAALRGYDPALELAAMTLGAGPWRSFRRVTFPMIRAGIAAGAVFAFAVSFDELMLALFLTNPRTETLPRLLWEYLAQTLTPAIAAVATLILLFTLALLAAMLLLRRPDELEAAMER